MWNKFCRWVREQESLKLERQTYYDQMVYGTSRHYQYVRPWWYWRRWVSGKMGIKRVHPRDLFVGVKKNANYRN